LYTEKAVPEKFKFFDKLLPEIKGEVAQFLPNKDFINLSMTSKANSPIFGNNPHIEKQYETRKVRKFLHHVVRGNHEAVAKMLGCLPTTKIGEGIKAELLRQYQKIKEHGVTYTLHGVTKHDMPETITKTEKHFDFEGTIIKQLQEYVDNGDENQWRRGVGGAQRLLPAHVVHEYCSDTPFYPVPKFKKKPKSSKEFHNWITNKSESWFDANSKLGGDFAVYKGRTLGAWASWGGVGVDLKAVKALYKVRTNDFQSLEDNLKPCNSSENKYNY